MFLSFNLQISAKHGLKDDIVGEKQFRTIKLIFTVYFDFNISQVFFNWVLCDKIDYVNTQFLIIHRVLYDIIILVKILIFSIF